jgi:hypothetical protein
MRFLYIVLFLSAFSLKAQTDTITIVSYNLLNFPNGRTDCGASNVNLPNRTDTLRKILGYIKPDIFVACEIQTEAGADSVLTRSLNVYGASNYVQAEFDPQNTDASLNNSMYFNSDKLTLLWQDVIETSPRNIDHYVLYVNDPNLGVLFDTTFIEVYMCHLKAGSGSAEQATRDLQTEILMEYIATRPQDRNHFVCGDLNVYTSNEAGYQNLLSGPFGLKDPINKPGSWNNNGVFADIHTQSPRTSGGFDCGSTGGLDDRFDQILVSNNVMNGSDSLKYLPNSYKAIGNDGNHFNSNLLASPVNSQYPDSIVRALFYMSDHLPVALKAVVTYPTSNGLALYPVVDHVECNGGNNGTATIVANAGQPPYSYQWDVNTGNQTTATATGLSSGSYCVVVTDALGENDDYCVYVNQPAAIITTVFRQPDTGSCNGQAHVLVSGGTGPYSISWNDPQAQTGQSAYNLCEGAYTVTVIDANGCTIENAVIIEELLGLVETETAGIEVYPVPFMDEITIRSNEVIDPVMLRMYSAFGVEMKVDILHNNEKGLVLNTRNIESGTYFLSIKTNNGFLVKKIVK